MRKIPFLTWACILAAFFISSNIHAQIGLADANVYQGMGIDKRVNCVLPLPDGTVVVAGDFAVCNDRQVRSIAKLNADGSTYASFNAGTGVNGNINAIALQPDGKLLVGGNFTSFNGTTRNSLVRLNADGSLDASYTIGAGFNSYVWDIYANSDTTAIVVGNFITFNGDTVNYIVKLRSDGSRDTSFATGTGASSEVYAIARQTDGKYVIGGAFTSFNGTSKNRIFRLNSNGTTDSGFSGVSTGASSTVRDIAIMPSGKIAIAGELTSYNGSTVNRFALLNTDGSRYTGFTSSTAFNATVYSIAIQPDCKILATGNFTTYKGSSIARVIRIDSTGTRDTTFNPGAGLSSIGYGVSVDANAKVYVGGTFLLADMYSRLSLARLNSTGSVDYTFFKESKVNDAVYALGVRTDGKVILGGVFTRFNEHAANRICQVNADGTLDTTYNTGTGVNGLIEAIWMLPGNKALIGGDFTTYSGVTANRMACVNADGTLDTTFNTGTGFNGRVRDIEVDDSGKIYVVGDFTEYNGNTENRMVSLNTDGSENTTFNAGTGFNARADQLRIQPDGKILVGGDYTTYNGNSRNRLVRLSATGAMEGTGTFNIGTGAGNDIYTVDIQPNGGILMGGNFGTYGGTTKLRLARANSNGAVDNGYAGLSSQLNEAVTEITYYRGGALIGGVFTAPGQAYAYVDTTGALDTTTVLTGPVSGNQTQFLVNDIVVDNERGRLLIAGDFTAVRGKLYKGFSSHIIPFENGVVAIDSISVLPSTCQGSTTQVRFYKQKYFNSGNTFTVQLSDTSGAYTSPVTIGSEESYGQGWDTVRVTIPDSAIPHSNYKVRIVATNAIYTSSPSTPFSIYLTPQPPIAPAPQTGCSDTAYTFTWDSIQVGTGGDSIEWSIHSDFDSSFFIGNYGCISVSISVSQIDTVWLRTINSSTGCTSEEVWTLGSTKCQPIDVFYKEFGSDDPDYYTIVYKTDKAIEDAEAAGEEEYEEFLERYHYWRQFWSNRVTTLDDNRGSFRPYLNAVYKKVSLPSSCDVPIGEAWHNTGPFTDPYDGFTANKRQNVAFTSEVWVEPGNEDHIVTNTSYGGLFETENGTALEPVWHNITWGTPPLYIQGLQIRTHKFAVKKNDFDQIWTATFILEYETFTGIHYTLDGGTTWHKDTTFPVTPNVNYYANEGVLGLAFSPAPSPNILYATTPTTVYKKDVSNPQNPWVEITGLADVTSPGYKCPVWVPGHGEQIFIGSSYFGTNAPLYYSSDTGTTWQRIDGFQFNNVKRSVAVSVPTDTAVYAFVSRASGTDFSDGFTAIYRSRLDTIVWTLLGSSYIGQQSAVGVKNADFEVSRSVNPQSGFPIMYLGLVNLRYSINAGQSWLTANNCPSGVIPASGSCLNLHADVRDVLINTTLADTSSGRTDKLYLATDGGVSFKTDTTQLSESKYFKNKNGYGLGSPNLWTLDIHPLNSETRAYGAVHQGLNILNNNSWRIRDNGDGYNGEFDENGNIYFTSGGGSGSSLGDAFTTTGPGPELRYYVDTTLQFIWSDPNNDNGSLVKPMKQHPNGHFYIGLHHVVRASTRDTTPNRMEFKRVAGFDKLRCDSWVSTGGGGYCNTSIDAITAFDVAIQNDSFIVFAYTGPEWKNDSSFVRTRDMGQSYDIIFDSLNRPAYGSPLSSFPIADIKINPNDPNDVWVALKGTDADTGGTPNPDPRKVYRSMDGGDTWCNISDGLSIYPINRLLFENYADEVVYAATTVGVFKWVKHATDPCGGYWECMNSGLPPGNVVDVRIDYCKKKMFAGLFGLGVWECDMPELQPAVAEHIETSTAMGSGRIDHDIIIDSGAVLTVTNSTLEFYKDANIVIRPGGKLTLTNSTLTDACNCMWDGIIVEGKPTEAQIIDTSGKSNQGYLVVTNSIIQNAYEAVRVHSPGWTNGDMGTGGIVQATGSTFKNNRRSIEFLAYHHSISGMQFDPNEKNNASYFASCTFTTDTNHKSDHPFSTHVTMWEVKGVSFTSCTFENKAVRGNVDELGHGITSIDASYNIKNSSFKGFWRGVWANGAWFAARPVNVTNTLFEDNYRALALYTTHFSTVAGNTFKCGKVLTPSSGISYYDPQDVITGAELNGSMGFTFEQNSFEATDTIGGLYTVWTTGAWANNTGEVSNHISSNSFDDIPFGVVVNGENRNSNGNFGLQMGCNNHFGISAFDFAVTGDNDTTTNDGVRMQQGEANVSIGNTFNAPVIDGDTISEGHYRNAASQNINYNYEDSTERPVYHTLQGKILPVAVGISATCSDDSLTYCYWCMLDGSTITQMTNGLNGNHTLLTAKRDTLYTLMDEGDSPGLIADIQGTTWSQATEMRNRLVADGPYVSAKAIIQVGRMPAVFSDTLFLNIVSANPDVKNEPRFNDYFPDKRRDLVAWIADSIDNIYPSTARTVRESEITHFADTVSRLARLLSRDAVNDTAGIRHQELRNYIGKLNGTESSLLIATDLMNTGEFEEADSIITVLANADVEEEDKIRLQKQVTVSRIQLRNMSDGKNLKQLNSTDLDSLLEINGMVLQEDGTFEPKLAKYAAGTMAGNILRSFYQADTTALYWEFAEEPLFPSVSGHTRMARAEENVKPPKPEIQEWVKVYPNPAKDILHVAFETTEKEAYISVTDLPGREIFRKKVGGGKNTLDIATETWNNGTYIYEVRGGNKRIGSGVVMISK